MTHYQKGQRWKIGPTHPLAGEIGTLKRVIATPSRFLLYLKFDSGTYAGVTVPIYDEHIGREPEADQEC